VQRKTKTKNKKQRREEKTTPKPKKTNLEISFLQGTLRTFRSRPDGFGIKAKVGSRRVNMETKRRKGWTFHQKIDKERR